MFKESKLKNSFRILKGGKISLVVSALVASTVLATSANADINGLYDVAVPQGYAIPFSGYYVLGTDITQYSSSNATYTNETTRNISDGAPRGVLLFTGNDAEGSRPSTYSFTNNSTIGMSSPTSYVFSAKAEGMVVDQTGLNGTFQNDVITVINGLTGSINVRAMDNNANAIAVYMGDVDSVNNRITITNNGDLSANVSTNSNFLATGISVSGATMNNGIVSVTNNKNITVKGDGESTFARGIYFNEMQLGSTITNGADGVITAYGLGNVHGISSPYSVDGSTITNEGKIYASSSGYGTVAIMNYDGYGEITNSGVIEATYNNSQSIFDMFDPNTNTIQNGSLDYSAYAIKTFGNVFNNTTNGHINGNLSIGGNLINEGTVSLPYNANGSFSASISGDFTNSGTLEIGVKNVNGTLSYSQLNVGSSPFDRITFTNGSKINVNVLDQTNTNSLLIAGTTVLEGVIKTDTGMFIDQGLVITDNSVLVDFEKEYDNMIGMGVNSPAKLNLKVVKASSNNIVDTTIAGGGQTPAREAAKTLQFIQDGGNHPQMNTVFTQLNNLTSNEAVAIAVESTTPQSTTSTQTASNQISNNIANVVMQRQNPNFGAGVNSGDEIFEDKNLWIKPFGSIGSQANKDGMNGFDVKSYGLGMGFDGKNKNDQMLGFGLFFTDANVDMNNVSQETDIKAYSMMAYGSLPVIDDKTNFLYQVGYSLQKTDSVRDVFTGDSASADYTSKMASIDTRLVRDYQINKDLMLQPLVFATYRNFKSPSYSETGAGALNLDVEKSSSNEMLVGLGTIATYKLNLTDKLIGSLNVGYDLKDDNNSISSSYQGASGVSFETQGIDNGRWSYDAGIGYEKSIDNKNSVSVNYNFQGEGSDYTNNVVSANYIYKF